MGGKKIEDLKNIKVGRYIIIDDCACRVSSITHSKPGKHGGAKVQIVAEDMFSGSKKSLMKPASDKCEVPIVDKNTAQVLTVVGDTVQLMDMTSYETFEMPLPEDPDIKGGIREGAEVTYMEALGKRKIIQASGG